MRRVEKEIQKLEQEARQKLKQLSSQKFSCQPDALPAAIQLSGKLKYHKLTNIYAPSFIGVKKTDKPGYKLQAIAILIIIKIMTQLYAILDYDNKKDE